MKKITLGIYELGMGFGCWAKSYEPATMTEGDVRVIGGLLMSIYRIHHAPWYSLRSPEVWWTPVDKEICYNAEFQRNWLATVTE